MRRLKRPLRRMRLLTASSRNSTAAASPSAPEPRRTSDEAVAAAEIAPVPARISSRVDDFNDDASFASSLFLPAPVLTWEEFDDGARSSRATAVANLPPVELCESLAALLSRPDRAAPRAEPPPQRRARWRRLLARQDLVEKHLGGRGGRTPRASLLPPVPDRPTDDEASPRSSLDLDEPRSNSSWGCGDDSLEPPSPTLRSWRSCSSRSFRPRAEDPPRALSVIGRQHCMNDISHLVDAANSPCISYDRQIFDPVSKLWRYVGADEPASSPWELGPPSSLGSPVTTRSGTPAGAPYAVASSPSLPTPAAMHAAAARRKVARAEAQAAARVMVRRHLIATPRALIMRPWSPAASHASSAAATSSPALRSPTLLRTSSTDRRPGGGRHDESVPLHRSKSYVGMGSWAQPAQKYRSSWDSLEPA